jgi:hypothetical protein
MPPKKAGQQTVNNLVKNVDLLMQATKTLRAVFLERDIFKSSAAVLPC